MGTRKPKKKGAKPAGNAAPPRSPRRPQRPQKPRMIDDELQQPSNKLGTIIGNSRISFRQANRKVWLHIQRKGYRSRQDKRMIDVKGNQPLTNLFGKTSLSMFEMSRILRGELT
jgi:chromatin remodeling complex protein RSC6